MSEITPRRPKILRLLMANSPMIPNGVAWVLPLLRKLLPIFFVLKSGMMSREVVMFSKKYLRKREWWQGIGRERKNGETRTRQRG
jgi:hypothetical protein